MAYGHRLTSFYAIARTRGNRGFGRTILITQDQFRMQLPALADQRRNAGLSTQDAGSDSSSAPGTVLNLSGVE